MLYFPYLLSKSEVSSYLNLIMETGKELLFKGNRTATIKLLIIFHTISWQKAATLLVANV